MNKTPLIGYIQRTKSTNKKVEVMCPPVCGWMKKKNWNKLISQ